MSRRKFILRVIPGSMVAGWIAGCGCQPPPASSNQNSPSGTARYTAVRTIRVAAASDLKFAMDELVESFALRHPNISVQVTYGSSGNFYAQLMNSAPFDLFFSADRRYPQQLIDKGLADPQTLSSYGLGQIVLWVPQTSRLELNALGLQIVNDPSIQKIAIANPEHAPYGRAAVAALTAAGLYDQIQSKLVVGENVSQAAQFVESGAADVGIIALSLALAPAMQQRGRFWKIPLDQYPMLEQAVVLISATQERAAATEFQDFVTGSEGRRILSRFGFQSPDSNQ